MKKNFLSATWLLLAASYPLSAQEKIDSDAPCTVVLCMYGKLQGNNQSEYSGAVRKFFSLRKFGSHGFRPWKTLIKRKDFLNGCPTADPLLLATY